MRKQMIGVEQVGGKYTTMERLEWRLLRLGVLKGLSEMKQDGKERVEKVSGLRWDGVSRRGGWGMETWGESDDEDVGND